MAIETNLHLLKRRRTKIVATLGPASASPDTIAALIEAGVSVFRLNFSHGDHDGHRQLYQRIRHAADERSEPVAVLGDLSGPKIRTGRFQEGGIDLVEGETVVVTTRDVLGEPGLIPSRYQALADDVGPGDRILLDDGTRELSVESVADTEITCRVVHGGRLTDRKGMNLPGVAISAPSLTEKDRRDAAFAVELGVDFLALSFVRRADDVRKLRDLVGEQAEHIGIIAKIEKPEALGEIEDIIAVSDGIMVARGDLGVELPPEQVPLAQRHLVRKAREQMKPVIIATQMLESMVRNPRATRAEVTDVSHAVNSGADAVMLSGETAAGQFPLESVRMMDRVVRHTEAFIWSDAAFGSLTLRPEAEGVRPERPVPLADALARASSLLSRDLMVRAILVVSRFGSSAGVVASGRPAAPVVAVSNDARTCRRMNLVWGCLPVLVGDDETEDSFVLGRRLARQLALGDEGQSILVVRGYHADPVLNQPSITVVTI